MTAKNTEISAAKADLAPQAAIGLINKHIQLVDKHIQIAKRHVNDFMDKVLGILEQDTPLTPAQLLELRQYLEAWCSPENKAFSKKRITKVFFEAAATGAHVKAMAMIATLGNLPDEFLTIKGDLEPKLAVDRINAYVRRIDPYEFAHVKDPMRAELRRLENEFSDKVVGILQQDASLTPAQLLELEEYLKAWCSPQNKAFSKESAIRDFFEVATEQGHGQARSMIATLGELPDEAKMLGMRLARAFVQNISCVGTEYLAESSAILKDIKPSPEFK